MKSPEIELEEEDVEKIFDLLERKCGGCAGLGCYRCNQSGQQLTDLGWQLLRILERHTHLVRRGNG
jgi:hypothetical protein